MSVRHETVLEAVSTTYGTELKRRSIMKHVCIRIYPNASAKYTVRDAEGLDSWLGYNKVYRPGNTLLVDGEIVEGTGLLSGEELLAVRDFVLSRKLRNTATRQTGGIGFGYPDDDELVDDWSGQDFLSAFKAGRKGVSSVTNQHRSGDA